MVEEKKSNKKKRKENVQKKDFWGKLGEMVKEAVDCCIE